MPVIDLFKRHVPKVGTSDVVKAVALNPTILESFPFNHGESIDTVLHDPTKAQTMDNDMLYLVTQMKGK